MNFDQLKNTLSSMAHGYLPDSEKDVVVDLIRDVQVTFSRGPFDNPLSVHCKSLDDALDLTKRTQASLSTKEFDVEIGFNIAICVTMDERRNRGEAE